MSQSLDDPSTYVAPLCLANERSVLDTIRAAAVAALEAYPAPDAADDAPAAFLTRNQRMARRLVETEKRILDRTIAAVGKQADDLAARGPDAFARRSPDVLSNFK